MHVCICICIYVHTHIHTPETWESARCTVLYTRKYACMYMCVCVYMYTHIHTLETWESTRCTVLYASKYACMYVCMCIYVHTHTHTPETWDSTRCTVLYATLYLCMYMCVYVYMYTHTYTHQRLQSLHDVLFYMPLCIYVCIVCRCIHVHTHIHTPETWESTRCTVLAPGSPLSCSRCSASVDGSYIYTYIQMYRLEQRLTKKICSFGARSESKAAPYNLNFSIFMAIWEPFFGRAPLCVTAPLFSLC